MFQANLFSCILISVLASSCAHRAQKWIDKKIIPDTNSYTIAVNKQQAKKSIKVLYTGCGGLVIFKDEEGIMTDPYYTGHRWWNLLWKKIDPENDKRVLNRINKINTSSANIKTVLISHAHYDHLEDLPYLLKNKFLGDTVKIIGDSSTLRTVSSFTQTPVKFISSDTSSYNQTPKPVVPLKWIQVSAHMRVLVIEADHAPHYRKIHLMRGKTSKQPLKDPEERSHAFRWHEGRTFSYILDVMDEANKKPLLRLFIQSSSCLPPYGFPPDEVLKDKKVDVAFLGVASSGYVKPYPKDILERLRPEKIVLVHWEDFFRYMYSDREKSVRLTSMNNFMRHLRKQYKCYKTKELAHWFSMPKPLTEIKIEY